MHRTHFLTGSTGFVGAALVVELLRQTEDPIILITRPGKSSAEQRFREAFEQAVHSYELCEGIEAAAAARIRVVAGDITQPGCNLTADVAGAKQFWHCAASLNYENRYVNEIRTTNVEGTRNALALARSLGVKEFNYISTAYVAGKRTGRIPEAFEEAETHNHYERSKLDAELLVLAAEAFRTRILRPSIVIGHSRTLAATNFSGLYGFLRQLVQLRGMTNRTQEGLLERTPLRMKADPDLGLNLIPVDVVARQAVKICMTDEAEGIFHLTHPEPIRVDHFLETLFETVGLHKPLLVAHKDDFNWIEKRFDKQLDFYGSYMIGDKLFERSRSDALLGEDRHIGLPLEKEIIEAFSRWYLERLEMARKNLPTQR